MANQLEKLIEEIVEETLEEVNALSAGAGSLQPSGQVSGTGGNPLGRDMSDQHEIMWSGDKPEKKKSLKEEFLDEEELEEVNAIGTGAVVGYTLPLGMKPDYKIMGTKIKKKKRPRRWYDIHKESVDEEVKKRFEIPLTSSNFLNSHSKKLWYCLAQIGNTKKVNNRWQTKYNDLSEQVNVYGEYNWSHVSPENIIDKEFLKLTRKLYTHWLTSDKILAFDPDGIAKDAVKGLGRGIWQPEKFVRGQDRIMLLYPNTQKIEVFTNLKDPRIAIALSTSKGWIPGLENFSIIKSNNLGQEEILGNVGVLLSNIRKKKIRSKQWNRGEQIDYETYEFEILQDLSDHDWYHATRLSNLRSILEKGLMPSGKQTQGTGWTEFNLDLQNAVYLTASKTYASDIAETLLGRFNEPGVVLRISGKVLTETDKLVVDEDSIRNSYDGVVSGGELKVGLPDYMSSVVDKIESVGFEGVIPSEAISIEMVVDAVYERNEEGEIVDVEVMEYPWEEWQKIQKNR